MKAYLSAVVIPALSSLALGLAGCAEQASNATTSADPAKKGYSRQDLQNTGRHDTAGAAQAIDPSVTVSSGRR